MEFLILRSIIIAVLLGGSVSSGENLTVHVLVSVVPYIVVVLVY